jgi:hypothetical protein
VDIMNAHSRRTGCARRGWLALVLMLALLLAACGADPGGGASAGPGGLVSRPAADPPGTATWDGEAGDGLWSSATNWVGDVLPAGGDNGDNIVIPAFDGQVLLDMDYTLTGNMTIGASGATSPTLVIDSGKTLTVDNTGSVYNPGYPRTLQTWGDITVNGSLLSAWSSNRNYIVLRGTQTTPIQFTNNGVTGPAWMQVIWGTVTNNGTLNGALISNTDGTVTLKNSGTYTDAHIASDGSSDDVLIVDNTLDGSISTNTSSPGASAIYLYKPNDVFSNSGTVDNAGRLVTAGTFTNNGTVNNAATGQIENQKAFLNGGTINNLGSFINSCNLTTYDLGTFDNSKGSLTGNPVVDQCVMWTNGSGDGKWSTAANWSDGAVPGAVTYIILHGESGDDTAVVLDADATVSGTLIVGRLPPDGINTSLTIDSSRTLTVAAAGALRLYTQSITDKGAIDNQGLMRLEGTVAAPFLFDNPGTLTLESGSTLTGRYGTVANSGTIHNDGAVTFELCSVVLSPTGTITGSNYVRGICKTWDGGAADGKWSSAANWDNDSPPLPGDSITIPAVAGEVHLDVNYTLSGAMQVGSGAGPNPTLVIDAGVTLTHDNTADGQPKELRTYGDVINNGTIYSNWTSNRNDILLAGTQTTPIQFTNNGTVEAETLNLDWGTATNNGTMTNARFVHIDGTAMLENHGSYDEAQIVTAGSSDDLLTIVNAPGATISTVPAASYSIWLIYANDTFNNGGTLSNTGSVYSAGTFNNAGTLDNTLGSFDNEGIFNQGCTGVIVGNDITGNMPVLPESCPSGSGGGGGGGGCLITTAARGSPMEADLPALRAFRDRVLRATQPGRALVRLYYRASPAVARLLAGHEGLRALVRLGLSPVVYAVEHPLAAAGRVLPAL